MFETVHSLYLVMMLVTGGDLNQKVIQFLYLFSITITRL